MSDLVMNQRDKRFILSALKIGNEKTDLTIVKWFVKSTSLFLSIILTLIMFAVGMDEISSVMELDLLGFLWISIGILFVIASIIGIFNEKVAGLFLFSEALLVILFGLYDFRNFIITVELTIILGFYGLYFLIIWRYSRKLFTKQTLNECVNVGK